MASARKVGAVSGTVHRLPERSPTGGGGDGEEPLDGRRARAERNREAVVDAVLALLREGVERPGAAEVAERAGVSVRSVFRHFDDLESLLAVATARQSERLGAILADVPLEGGLDERLQSLVARRARAFEDILLVRRAAEQHRRSSPTVAEALGRSRRSLKRQLVAVLGDDAPTGDDGAVRLLALEAALSPAAWHQYRLDQGCSPLRAEQAMLATARALLTAG